MQSSVDKSPMNYIRFRNLESSAKKMILIGVNYPDEDFKINASFYEDDSVLILTETTSNIASEKIY